MRCSNTRKRIEREHRRKDEQKNSAIEEHRNRRTEEQKNRRTEEHRKLGTLEQRNKRAEEKGKKKRKRRTEERKNRGKGERRSVRVQVRFVTKLQNSSNLKILIKTWRNRVHHSL